jgi:hypothetical protein
MKILKKSLIGITFIFCIIGKGEVIAGTEAKVTADPTFDDFGNTRRTRGMEVSISNLVLISSVPTAAMQTVLSTSTTLGISMWRHRMIINVSTSCNLALYSSSNYNAYSSSIAVVLSSDTTGRGLGDKYIVPDQDAVWGIWNDPGAPLCAAGKGAAVIETYWSRKNYR